MSEKATFKKVFTKEIIQDLTAVAITMIAVVFVFQITHGMVIHLAARLGQAYYVAALIIWPLPFIALILYCIKRSFRVLSAHFRDINEEKMQDRLRKH